VSAREDQPTTGFWIGLGIGGLVMAWGARLYLEATPDLARRVDLAAWLVGLAFAHDLLLGPVIVGSGYLVGRVVPAGVRPAVQVALILTGSVVAVGLLPLLGTAPGTNPTIQPLDDGPSIAAVVVVIWVGALVAARLGGLARRKTGSDARRSGDRRRTQEGSPT
jgi:hypothetical protein